MNPAISGKKVFCLSALDYIDGDYGFYANTSGVTTTTVKSRQYTATTYAVAQGVKKDNNNLVAVWMRSPYVTMQYVGNISELGYLAASSAPSMYTGVNPAINLRTDAILFTTPAKGAGEDGKSTSFEKVKTGDVSEWKITLKDSNSFNNGTSVKLNGEAVSNQFISLSSGYSGQKVQLQHKALNALGAQYNCVTAALVSTEDNSVLYYGNIQSDVAATSSILTVPEGLNAGMYKLQLYAEDQNEAQEVDYATGTPYEITIEVQSESGHTHVFDDWKNEGNCGESTTEKRTCQLCSAIESRDSQHTTHEWDSEYTIDKVANCTTDGSKSKHCKYCDSTTDVQLVKASGHTGGVASCSDKAICKICDEEYGELLAHDYNEEWVADCGCHWHACKYCTSRKDVEAHHWTDAVTIQQGVMTTVTITKYTCSDCNQKKTVITKDNDTSDSEDETNPGSDSEQDENVGETTGNDSSQNGNADGTTIGGNSTQVGDTGDDNTAGNPVTGNNTNTPGVEENSVNNTNTTNVQENNVNNTNEGNNSVNDITYCVGYTESISGITYKITQEAANGAGMVACVAPVDKNIISVQLPSTIQMGGVTYQVTAVEKGAFKGCNKLKNVKMEGNITSIGAQAFYNCKALSSITLGKKVSKIGNKAFYGCKKLLKMTIKTDKLTSKNIGKKAFTKVGSSNYGKLVIKVPAKKLSVYKKLLQKKEISSKAKIKK